MATKNVQLKDMSGNDINPKTLGSLVFNNSNEALGTVEAGAEVNIIESVKVNGTALPISNKEVNVEIAAHKEYSVGTATATEGFLRAWQLTKDGQAIATSTKIDLPKDIVFKVFFNLVKFCSTALVSDLKVKSTTYLLFAIFILQK